MKACRTPWFVALAGVLFAGCLGYERADRVDRDIMLLEERVTTLEHELARYEGQTAILLEEARKVLELTRRVQAPRISAISPPAVPATNRKETAASLTSGQPAAVSRSAGVSASRAAVSETASAKPKKTAAEGDVEPFAFDAFTAAVQRALAAAGFNPGPIDGRKGRMTTVALRSFQRRQGLPQSGVADEQTWRVLRRHL